MFDVEFCESVESLGMCLRWWDYRTEFRGT